MTKRAPFHAPVKARTNEFSMAVPQMAYPNIYFSWTSLPKFLNHLHKELSAGREITQKVFYYLKFTAWLSFHFSFGGLSTIWFIFFPPVISFLQGRFVFCRELFLFDNPEIFLYLNCDPGHFKATCMKPLIAVNTALSPPIPFLPISV